MTTPTEALATALAPAFGPSYFPGLTDVTIHGTSPEEVAALILAALPPGWHLIDGTALLGELGESPLPGARYAYEVVKRFLGLEDPR